MIRRRQVLLPLYAQEKMLNLVLLDADSCFARVPPPTVDAEEGDVELRRAGEVYGFDWLSQKTVAILGLGCLLPL